MPFVTPNKLLLRAFVERKIRIKYIKCANNELLNYRKPYRTVNT